MVLIDPVPASPSTGTPRLICVVHGEEEFDWNAPFARHAHALTHLAELPRIQALFERNGFAPVYACDYPLTRSRRACAYLSGWIREGRAHLGSHLHPWVNPPYEERVGRTNSFPCNLPEACEREKLARLTDRLAMRVGVHPELYLAGRYGVDWRSLMNAQSLGYKVDLSFAPAQDHSGEGGPDFSRWRDCRPFWRDGRGSLYCIPVSVERAGVPGAGRARRARLSPEGLDFAAMKRLTHRLLRRGVRLFTLHVHSPSFAPGHTPYAPDSASCEALIVRLEAYLRYFAGPLGGVSTDPIAERERALACKGEADGKRPPLGTARPSDPPRVAPAGWHFPPGNAIAAIRAGKMARHLPSRGMDLRVITVGRGAGADHSLALEVPSETIIHTGWRDIDATANPLRLWRRAQGFLGAKGRYPGAVNSRRARLLRKRFRAWLAALRRDLTLWPDVRKG